MLILLLMGILAKPLICLILTAASLDGSSGFILDGNWTARNSNKSIVIPAKVPGGIYTDLMRAKVIGDPYFRFNDELYKWVGRENWEFYRTFEVPNGLLSKKRVSLVAEGLDTIGSIFINDKLVGTSENMFVRYNFNITSHLRASNNSIKISFVSPVNYAKNKSQEYQTRNMYVVPPVCPPVIQNGECHVNFIRKCQSSFSWDWGPSFPSTGIWKSIRIEAYNTVIIRDVSVFPVPKDSNLTDWSLNITVYYETATITAVPGTLSVALNGTLLFVEALELPSNTLLQGNITVTAHIFPKYPIKLWWPNGYGDQPLYNLSVMFTDSFKSETSKSVNIGFRTVNLIEEKIQGSTGLSFYFQINGLPIFAKGSNWIPADSFPERITKDYIRHLLQSAKDANMNMLRVWGGGIYEPDSFYELADEMGILIWQDMMFAVALYPVNNEFLNSVATEVQQQIQRLQHHPSIVVWAGNNENEAGLAQGWWPVVATDFGRYKRDYINLYINTIKPIVTQDKSRPFLASSPSNGKISEQEGWISSNPQDDHYGDVHFYTYSSDGWNWRSYPRARFVSEYGFQSYPSFETFSNISLPEDWTYPFGKFLFHRQHHIFGGIEILMSIKSHLFLPNKKCGVQAFKDVLYLSQITQAMSIKTETEFYRRSQTGIVRGEGKTMGALYWQLNDIWQAPTWSSIEYGGKWKMLHYYAVNFFNNYLVSPFDDNKNISVAFISDQPKPLANLSLILEVHRWSSLNTTYTRRLTFNQPPQSSQVVYTTPISELLAQAKCNIQECLLNFLITDKKGLQLGPSNFHFFTSFHEAKGLGKANITVESVSLTSSATGSKDQVFTISLATDRVAPFVWLDSPTVKGHFSTNGFLFLTPKMKVQFYAKQAISSEMLRNVLTVKSLMDTCV